MEPLGRPQATLVDLLDRVLDRGLVIDADIVITLAGVPLVGLNLRAALAGMETMVQYGLMREWDQSIRARGKGAAVEGGSVGILASGGNGASPQAGALSSFVTPRHSV